MVRRERVCGKKIKRYGLWRRQNLRGVFLKKKDLWKIKGLKGSNRKKVLKEDMYEKKGKREEGMRSHIWKKKGLWKTNNQGKVMYKKEGVCEKLYEDWTSSRVWKRIVKRGSMRERIYEKEGPWLQNKEEK